jgi:hypothetical protein
MTGILGAMVGGSGGPTIQLVTPVSLSYASSGTSAIVSYAIDPDGYVYTYAGGPSIVYTQAEQWDNMPATTGNYEVRATLSSGTAPSGTLGSWTPITAQQAWTLAAIPTFFPYKTCVLTIEVRDTATSTVKATATVTLTADSR